MLRELHFGPLYGISILCRPGFRRGVLRPFITKLQESYGPRDALLTGARTAQRRRCVNSAACLET